MSGTSSQVGVPDKGWICVSVEGSEVPGAAARCVRCERFGTSTTWNILITGNFSPSVAFAPKTWNTTRKARAEENELSATQRNVATAGSAAIEKVP